MEKTQLRDPDSSSWKPWALAVLLVVTVVWAYWRVCRGLWTDWKGDDNYSVGQLVPLAAIYLLWHDRHRMAGCMGRPCWLGLLLILLGLGARAFGLIYFYESAERYSMLVTVCGVVLLITGWRCFWRFKWLLLFLFLMIPLPGRIHNLISGPLQGMATSGAVVLLELAGVTVENEGNVMVLNSNTSVAVAEACSGLRMLTAFVIVAATLAYIVDRPAWQKCILTISSVPVAIFCNLVRLVATCVLFMVVGGQFAERFFHDFAGFTMMPLAVLTLGGELWIMKRLVIDDEPR